jgi:hypothetical protein
MPKVLRMRQRRGNVACRTRERQDFHFVNKLAASHGN